MKRSSRQWARRIAEQLRYADLAFRDGQDTERQDLPEAADHFAAADAHDAAANKLARHRGWPTPVCVDATGLAQCGSEPRRVIVPARALATRYTTVASCVDPQCRCGDRSGVVLYDGHDHAAALHALESAPAGYETQIEER